MSSQSRRVVGLVSGSHFVHHAYIVVLAPLVGVLAAEFDVSLAAIGLAIGVQNAVVMLLQLPYGHVSDTYSRALVLAVSLVVATAGLTLTAFAQSYEWLLAAQVVLGVGIAGHHPAHYPLLAAVSTDGSRGRAYSAHAFGGSVGFAAPYAVVAATSALSLSWRVAVGVVTVVGAAYTLSTLFALRGVDDAVKYPTDGATAPARPTLASVRRGGRALPRFVRSTPRRLRGFVATFADAPGILGLTLLAFFTSAAAWCIRTYTPQLLTVGYALPDGTANLLVSAMFGVGATLILAGGALTDSVGETPVVYAGYAGLAVLAFALSTLVLPSVALVVVLLFSGSISFSRPARSALADRLSARTDLGKNFALVTIGISLGGTVAPPAFGYLLQTVGVSAAFAVVGVLGLLSLALVRWILGTSDGETGAAATSSD
ncbi:MFS transporter [Halogeometricum limi]|uniref:Predicted arabinose efflux permease, MFS family n=1 Tax=Halogeometricum limi TaxID=555875 RepID=A0A1I6GMU5_9EURY|nr:MFS transporter [Halogeometricum limi]SFR43543.1 Predicted arabinose efflux permease, MFS family [Halogeometricum limi]